MPGITTWRALVLVQPETVLRWHREIVRRRWTYGNTAKRGRPTIPAATIELIVRFARESPTWGCGRTTWRAFLAQHREQVLACDFFTRVLILNQAHLRFVLAKYVAYYNHRRPHQGRDQEPPVSLAAAPALPAAPAQIRCPPVLGGLIKDYAVAA